MIIYDNLSPEKHVNKLSRKTCKQLSTLEMYFTSPYGRDDENIDSNADLPWIVICRCMVPNPRKDIKKIERL